jgi:hypothetical protein
MNRLILSCLLVLLGTTGALRAQEAYKKEYIVITGGPPPIEWEKLQKVPHDHWWANFVRASRIRLGELRERHGDEAMITWLVYKPGYVRRGARQEKHDLLADIATVRDKYKVNLV